MSKNNWLETLTPGERVILHTYYDREVAVVARTTKTQIILKRNGHEWKFRRSDGYEVGGDSYNRCNIKPFDAEVVTQIEKERLQHKLHSALQNITRDQLKDLTVVQCVTILQYLDSFGFTQKKEA